MMAAWETASTAGQVCVLVTVVATRGSSYRLPGARMLILPDGSRIGAVSGGCLEGEVCRRAHWWTAESPAVLKTFDTSAQDDNDGFGLGCGGGIDLLLERLDPSATESAAHPLLAQHHVVQTRTSTALAVVVRATAQSGLRVGERFAAGSASCLPEIARLLRCCAEMCNSFTVELREGEQSGCHVFFESLAPPVQLLICGAGTDAQPVAAQAIALGWSVVVLDQRADLARRERFPEATRTVVVKDATAMKELQLDERTAAVVMSHSFAQDTFFLETLVPQPIRYLGVLGSRRRTMDLLARLGRDVMPSHLRAPAGLDIGAETPEQIALSILSEIQACFAHRAGGALRDRAGSIHGQEPLDPESERANRAGFADSCTLL